LDLARKCSLNPGPWRAHHFPADDRDYSHAREAQPGYAHAEKCECGIASKQGDAAREEIGTGGDQRGPAPLRTRLAGRCRDEQRQIGDRRGNREQPDEHRQEQRIDHRALRS
jgi:hypothetical protein